MTEKSTKRSIPKKSISIAFGKKRDVEVFEKVVELAAINERNFTEQVVFILKEKYPYTEKKNPLKKRQVITLPESMYRALAKRAEDNRMSMAALITAELENALPKK